jgi:hypothetical protein
MLSDGVSDSPAYRGSAGFVSARFATREELPDRGGCVELPTESQRVHGNHHHPIEAQLDQLRFLRYRKEVISSWHPSEEKRALLRRIELQIDSLVASSSSRVRQTTAARVR